MIRIIIFLVGCLYSSVAFAAFASFQASNGTRPTADTVCTAATGNCSGVGGGSSLFTPVTCNNSADDAPAFNSFNTWATGTWQVAHPGLLLELDTPNGGICRFLTAQGAVLNPFTRGIKRFQLVGYGTTFSNPTGSEPGYSFGRSGMREDSDYSSQFATITAGATSITISDLTKCAQFSNDDWVVLGGIDVQGEGFPPNPQIFEYIQINSVASCGGSGVITFKTATRNGYKSTWPHYNPGNSGFHADQGGPGTVYALDQDWNVDQTFYGLTLDQGFTHTNVNGRIMHLVDITVPPAQGLGPIPSQNVLWTATNLTGLGAVAEVDKIVETAQYYNLTYHGMHIQTGVGPQTLLCSNCIVDQFNGTGFDATFTGGHLAGLILGSTSFGYSHSFAATGTQIDDLQLTTAGSDYPVDLVGVWAGGSLTIPQNFTVTGTADNGSGLLRLTVDHTAGWTNGIVTGLRSFYDVGTTSLCSTGGALTVIDGTHFDIQGSDATANNIAVSIHSPAVFTKSSHGFAAGSRVYLGTTGALPTGLSANTEYFVLAAGLTASTFEVSLSDGGAAINTSGSQSGQQYLQCNGNGGILPVSWAVPNANILLSAGNTGPNGPILQVADLAVGANNETIISFNVNGSPYAGGLPTIPNGGAGTYGVKVHPSPSFVCTNCTGSQTTLDAANQPVGPYGSSLTRVVTSANSNVLPYMSPIGALTELDGTVTAACSGASNFNIGGPLFSTLGSMSTGTWNMTVDAHTASATPRKIFPTTSSGAQSGDTLTAPGADTWLGYGQTLPLYTNVGNCGSPPTGASTTVTIKTDQGVVP